MARESGTTRDDLPIWAPAPGVISYSPAARSVSRHEVPGVPGAFTLSNVLDEAECDALAALSESMGYTEDAPVSLGRHIRKNQNCVIIADDSLWRPVWERVREHMPQSVDHPHGLCSQAVGLNQRWRLYKYGESDTFKLHTDGSWPGSGLDASGQLQRDLFGDRWSQLTLLLYLDGGYKGGETTFYVPTGASMGGGGSIRGDGGSSGELVSVAVPKGSALAFFHGEHPLSLLHEGSLVTAGQKRIVRTDVLYSLPGRGPLVQAAVGANSAVTGSVGDVSGSWRVGAAVRVIGLTSATQHNGKTGRIVRTGRSEDRGPPEGRVGVQLDDMLDDGPDGGALLSVRHANLELLGAG